MNNNLNLLMAISFAAMTMVGCSDKTPIDNTAQMGGAPELPPAQNFLVPPMKVPTFKGWIGDAKPSVAQGLKIEKIADNLLHPRQLFTVSNGDILVVESNGPGEEAITTPKQLIASKVKNKSGKGAKGGNRISLLRQNTAGQWEKYIFLEGLHSPFGLQVVGNYLYVANTNNVMRYPFVAGQTKITDQGVELADLPDTINHHWTKSMVVSPDQTKLYVGVGSNSNIGENGLDVEYRRAAILEMDINSGASRIYASGVRNPTGLQFEPTSNILWAIANERDEIGSSLVPDYLTSVQDGGFYGWPYSYYGQHVDTRVKKQRPDLVAKAIKPDYALGSHVAALGLWFYNGTGLPPQYSGGAFVSNHGSWNRTPLSGYDVVFIPFSHGKPNGKPVPVVTGFHSKDESQLFGAPVGLTQDNSGALLIADDVGNTVWRVSSQALK